MRYVIDNRSNGEVYLPPPLGRFLFRGKSITFSTPTSLFGQQDGVTRDNKWQTLLDQGLISITVTEDETIDDKTEIGVETSLVDQVDALLAQDSTSSRFLTGSSPQYIYVHPTSGNDTTGDGLSMLTAYATLQRAIVDIPDGFKVDVIVQLPSGSFAGQAFNVNSLPSLKADGDLAGVYIIGDQTAAYSYATTGTGSLVAGKSSQVSYAVNHGLTITNGSHWVMNNTGDIPRDVRVLKASSVSELIFIQSSTAARLNEKICTYSTIFTSTFTANSVLGPDNKPFVRLVGFRMNASGVCSGIAFHGTSAAGSTFQDCAVTSGVFTTGATFSDAENYMLETRNVFFVGGCVFNGYRNGGLRDCVISNTTNPALTVGSSSALATHPVSGACAVSSCDFEGSGVGIALSGSGAFFITEGNITFALTNRAIDAYQGALVGAGSASTWSGTVTLPARLRSRSAFAKAGITYNVTNTANPGQDFDVGSAASVVAFSSNVTDPTDLSMLS